MNSFVYFMLDMNKYGLFFLLWILIIVSFVVFINYKDNIDKYFFNYDLDTFEQRVFNFIYFGFLFSLFIPFLVLCFTPGNKSDIIKQNFTQKEQDFAFYQFGEFANIGTTICDFSDYGSDTCQAYLKEKIKRVKQKYADSMQEKYIKQQEETARLERIDNNIKKLGGV